MVPIADIRITSSSSSGMCTLNLTNIRSKFFTVEELMSKFSQLFKFLPAKLGTFLRIDD